MHAQLINTTLTKKRVKKLGASFFEGKKGSFRLYVGEKQIRKLLRNNQIQCQLEPFFRQTQNGVYLVKISDWKSTYVSICLEPTIGIESFSRSWSWKCTLTLQKRNLLNPSLRKPLLTFP